MTWTTICWLLGPEPEGVPPVTIDRVRTSRGVRFAVRQGGACMAPNGTWEHEPVPSSRTYEWMDRFYFTTMEAAADAVARNVPTPWGRFAEYAEKGGKP